MHTGIIYLHARYLGQGDGRGCQLPLVMLLMLSTTSFIFPNFFSPSSHWPRAFPHFINLTVASQRWCMNLPFLLRRTIRAEIKFRAQQLKNYWPCWWRGVLQRTWHNQVYRSRFVGAVNSPWLTAGDFPFTVWVAGKTERSSPWIHQTEHVSSWGSC